VRNVGERLARHQGRIESAVIALAVGLVLYLPIEPTVLGGLSGAPYWVLRLLPDALIAIAAAAVMLVPGDKRREGVVLLWTLAGVTLAVVLLDALRHFGPGTTINALRVLLRYAVLGAALLAVVREPSTLLRKFAVAIAVAVIIQFAAGIVAVAVSLWPMVTGAQVFSGSALLGVQGTLGRYDRFAFLMVAGVLLGLADAVPGPRWLGRSLIVFGIVGLALSSSRQAMLSLALAAVLLAALPRLRISVRGLRSAVAVVSLLLVVLVRAPTAIQPNSDPDAPTAVVPAATQPAATQPAATPLATTQPTAPPMRAGLNLSLDPNENFRLYYNLKLLPWAAIHEPLLGFGPGEQSSLSANPALKKKVQQDGTVWPWAIQFTNDSEYASMVIQFGIFLPMLFLLLIGGLAFAMLRSLWHGRDDPWLPFALAYTAACLFGAGFGPAFETRTVSILLWLGLFGGFLLVRPPLAAKD
jgi:hypothetical protein